VIIRNKNKTRSRTEGKRPKRYGKSRREKHSKDCKGNSRAGLNHTITQHRTQQDKVSARL